MICALAAMLIGAAVASAAGITSSLFGGAVAEQSDVKLVSDLTDTSTANDFSGISFTLPAGTTFADLTQLSTEFNLTAGGCGGGSPRFTLHLSSGKNVFVYLGPSPNFTGCALNTWQSSGNLIGNNDTGRYDTSQVQAGTQSNTYAGALSLIGSQQVTSIDLVVDSGWFFNPQNQTVLVRNVQINGQSFVVPGTGTTKANPARLCKAELASMGKTDFEKKWGSNHNLHNAFGKCVSTMAHQHR
ncbi:MAG TPA: hypothetical protein VHP82_13155 [Gaiellaceae bacterium]|nr:hypothetical protein [Gaiellaceae bacterium]